MCNSRVHACLTIWAALHACLDTKFTLTPQYLVDTMFGIYTARGHTELSKVFDRYQFK